MDPEACWKDIERGMTERDRERVADSCDALIGWLEKGGWAPLTLSRFTHKHDLLRWLRDVRAVAEMP